MKNYLAVVGLTAAALFAGACEERGPERAERAPGETREITEPGEPQALEGLREEQRTKQADVKGRFRDEIEKLESRLDDLKKQIADDPAMKAELSSRLDELDAQVQNARSMMQKAEVATETELANLERELDQTISRIERSIDDVESKV